MSYLPWLLPLLALWLLAEFKTSRPDGTLERIHPFRRILLYLLPERNGAVVYFDAYADGEQLAAWLARHKEAGAGAPGGGVNMTHLTVAAANIALAATPKMNRFVVGRRLYRRNARWLSFSMKRARMDREAQISTVKLEMPDGEAFSELVARMNGGIKAERSGKKTRTDKELDLFNFFPRPVLRFGTWALKTADYYNLLPRAYIDGDPLFTSIFIANLGSLGMGAGYHHLFEYGNCPMFIMIGKLEDRVVVKNGQPVVRPMLHVRFTYEERIEDGLNARFGIDRFIEILENPGPWLDEGAMWPRVEARQAANG
ncbi:MAG: hypothetical protein Q8P41_23040 [Pseudomonadota bacterium]|nr:hypothetical protein [Pseudomonadota bacterium]